MIRCTLGWNSAVHVTCVLLNVRKLNYVFKKRNDNQLGTIVKTVASCEAGDLRIVINFPKLNRLPIVKVLCVLATSKID